MSNKSKPINPARKTNMTILERSIRLSVLIAFDDAIVADAQMTIVCYMGGQIRPWKDYPSMIPRV